MAAGNNDAADVKAAKEAGRLVPMARPNTIADGLQGRLGDLTWPIVRDLVDGVITISDQEILAAMRICFERMKVYLLGMLMGRFHTGRVDHKAYTARVVESIWAHVKVIQVSRMQIVRFIDGAEQTQRP